MTKEEIQDVLHTVDKLNEYLSDDLIERYGCYFSYETNGWWHGIKFMDIILWNTEDEVREWIDDENRYEPLYPFVLGEFQKFAKMISNLDRINKIKQLKKRT